MKRKFFFITTISLVSAFLIVICFFSLPWVLIALGIYLSPDPPMPENKHGEFPFRLVYEINGVQHTINDTIICNYAGINVDEGDGKYLKWEERLASGKELTEFFNGEYHYGIKLYDGFIQGQGSTIIFLDVGTPQYYLGYQEFVEYMPGRVNISSPMATGVIREDELWNKYNIRIIEREFSKPMIGNNISKSTPYKDTARLAVKDVTLIPHESSYPNGTKKIVFTLKNNTNKELSCEQSFYIQKEVEGKWLDVYREMAVGFSREPFLLEPHSQVSRTYDISKYTDNIPIGKYRVVSPVEVPVKKNVSEAQVLVGEFTIK